MSPLLTPNRSASASTTVSALTKEAFHPVESPARAFRAFSFFSLKVFPVSLERMQAGRCCQMLRHMVKAAKWRNAQVQAPLIQQPEKKCKRKTGRELYGQFRAIPRFLLLTAHKSTPIHAEAQKIAVQLFCCTHGHVNCRKNVNGR